MKKQDNPALREILLQATELAPEERGPFLASACAGNPELRTEVEALIRSLQAEDELLRKPTMVPGEFRSTIIPGADTRPPHGERAGERIGRYKLLQLIGEGGFGSVFMAEQETPVVRKVALKIIKLGMDTKQIIARFEAERQALALMDHPNIARVLDAGTTDSGRPYFVMELVRGVPITTFCDANKLTTRQRLELFVPVCSALQHAHQKGIIHRDLKPTNVLVTMHDDKPVPKIIDFGVAKAINQRLTEHTLFTEYRQLVGTPAYMSPEQAQMSGLDMDTRSDIYSLGVLLYELLTGTTPFDAKQLRAAAYEEMQRIIREVEPPKASTRLSTLAAGTLTAVADHRRCDPATLGRTLQGDLDWIMMKCLEKDRSRRYETANALARDIQRHLNDEPVEASPPSVGYQLRKLARRNKTALRVAAGIAAVLVVATAVSSWQAVRAIRAETKTAETLGQVAAERDAKELARKDAESISTFLSDVFQSPDPRRDGRTIRVVELLDKAAKKLETDLANHPERRTKLQATLGKTYGALGLPRQAIPLQEQVLEFRRRANGPEHPDTLAAMNGLANSYFDAGRRDEALKMQEELLTLRRKVNGPEHPDTLWAMNNLANSYADAGRRDEALKMREKVLTLRRKVNGPEHPDTLMAMNNLAFSYADAGRRDEALKMREEVLPLRRKVLGPEHPDTLAAMNNLAISYFDAGRRDEALKMREEVLTLRRKVNGPEHPETLRAMNNLALSYADADRRDEALKMRDELLPLSRKALGPGHPETLTAMNNLALSYADAGRRDEALKMREEVLTLRRKVNGPEHPDTLGAMHNLANSYFDAGRRDEALKMREEVLTLHSKVLGPEHPDTLAAMNNLAISYFDAGRRDEALKMQEEVLTLCRKVHGPEHPETLWAMLNLASSYAAAGRRDEALKMREEVLTLRRKVLGPDHPDTLSTMRDLSDFYRDDGRTGEAIALLERVRDEQVKKLGADDPDSLVTLHYLANVYRHAGRTADGIELLEHVRDRSAKRLGPADRETLTAMVNLAQAYVEVHRTDDALALLEQVRDEQTKTYGADHPYTLSTLQEIANAYRGAGRTDDAIVQYERVRDMRVKKLGADHPDTLTTVFDLANRYREAGRSAEGIKLLEDVYDRRAKRLGRAHRDTVNTLRELGDAYVNVGRTEDAIKVFEQVRDQRTQQLGREHVDTVNALMDLASAYQSAGRINDAIELLEQVRDLRMKTFGPEAPQVLDAWNTLGAAYRAAGRTADASKGAKYVRASLERSLQKESAAAMTRPSDSAILADRGAVYARLGRFQDAANDFAKAVQLAPDNHRYWHDGLMPVLIQLGDVDGFRRKLTEELQQFKSTTDAPAAHRVAKDAFTIPLEGEELKLAVELAERARHGNYDWYCQTKGMAEYRSGHYPEAIPWFAKSTHAAEWNYSRTVGDLFVAMSYEDLGDHQQARSLLNRAVHRMETEFPRPGEADLGGFMDWILCQVVRREAEELIDGKGPTTRPASSSQPVESN